jgi:hypothetical protein
MQISLQFQRYAKVFPNLVGKTENIPKKLEKTDFHQHQHAGTQFFIRCSERISDAGFETKVYLYQKMSK